MKRLQLIGWDGAGASRLAVVPGPVGVPSAMAAVTEDRFFVMVDGRVRSVLNGASAPITDDEHRNAGVPGIAVTSGKAIWLLEQGALRSVYQCVIEEFASNPPALCNPGRIGPLANARPGTSITALAAATGAVYWAELDDVPYTTTLRTCDASKVGSAVEPPPPCAPASIRSIGTFPGRTVAMTAEDGTLFVLTTDGRAGDATTPGAIRRVRAN